jgi:ABC-type molybdate transport system ATPase subunit
VVARLTHRSARGLDLSPGAKVFAQIKAVALIG